MKKKLLLFLMAVLAAIPSSWAAYENHYFKVAGGYNGWEKGGRVDNKDGSPQKSVALDNNGVGTVTDVKLTSQSDTWFRLYLWNGSSDLGYYKNGLTMSNNDFGSWITGLTKNENSSSNMGATHGRWQGNDMFDITFDYANERFKIIPVFYLHANLNNGSTFSHKQKLVYSETDGLYHTQIIGGDNTNFFIISTHDGLDFNKDTYGATSEDEIVSNGQKNVNTSNNYVWKFEGALTYDITLDWKNKKITFTEIPKVYSLNTNIFGSWEALEMTEQSDGTYKYSDKAITQTGKFGIKVTQNGQQIEYYKSSDSSNDMILNTPMNAVNDNSKQEWNVPEKYIGQTFTYIFNPNAKTVTVQGSEPSVSEPEPEETVCIYVNVENVGWNPPYIHYWGSNITDTSYPGVEMLPTSDPNIWVFEFPESAQPDGCLFSAGGSTAEADKTKTENVTFAANKVYYINYNDGGDNGVTEKTTADLPKPSASTHIYMSANVKGNDRTDGWKHGIELADNGNGIYTGVIKAENNTNPGNLICFFNTKVDEFPRLNTNRIGAGSANVSVTSGEAVQYAVGTTGYFSLEKGASYFIEFNANDGKVTFTKDDASNGYIYFVAPPDYFTSAHWRTAQGYKAPYAIFYNNDTDPRPAQQMQRIDAEMPLFRIAIPADPLNSLGHRVSFTSTDSYTKKSQPDNGDIIDVSGGAPIFHSYKTPYYEHNVWHKFIYVADNDAAASQSYCTFEELLKQREAKADKKLVIIGNGENTDNNDNWKPQNETQQMSEIVKDGVYIYKLNIQNPAFKVSYIKPYDIFKTLDTKDWSEKNIQEKRAWATFNLGLYGAPMLYFTDNYTLGRGVAKHHDGQNYNSELLTNVTYEFNSYSTYNWYLQNASSGDYWLVIDTDYGTAAVLNFNPTPQLNNIKYNSSDIFDLIGDGNESDKSSDYDRSLIRDVAIPGSDDSGVNQAEFRFVNSITAEATLVPARSDDDNVNTRFHDKYDAAYNVVYESAPLKTIIDTDSKDKSIVIDNMVLYENSQSSDDDDILTVRGTFTEKEYQDIEGKKLIFRSYTQSASVDNEIKLDTPNPPSIKFEPHLYNWYSDEGYLDVLLGIEYELPKDFITEEVYYQNGFDKDKNYAIYPTFDVKVNGVPAQLVGADNAYAWAMEDLMTAGTDPDNGQSVYEMPDSTGTVRTGSWVFQSIKAADGEHKGYLPLYAPSAVKIKENADYTKEDIRVEARIIATYPFYVDLNKAQADPQALPKGKSARMKAETTDADSEYTARIATADRPSPIATYEGSFSLSGVIDAAVAPVATGEEMLFNLQGVRITDANPAAGIYIRRAADGTVSKIAIK